MTSSLKLHVSISELRFYLGRAAFAVGIPWGIAHDFAQVASLLAAEGVDPAPMAARLLGNLECGRSSAPKSVQQTTEVTHLFAEQNKCLSTLFAGPALCDWCSVHAAGARPRSTLRIERVDAPVVAIAYALLRHERFEQIDIGGERGENPDLARVLQELAGVSLTSTLESADIRISAGAQEDHHQAPPYTKLPPVDGVEVDRADWDVVRRLFDSANVPSDDASRLVGAGAGLVDND